MEEKAEHPWSTGPGEILRHGLSLLRRDTDTNRRLAMISIDNAVELTIKTYLGLPQRVTGLSLPRKEFREIAESFPSLLDALERYAPERLLGIDLGTLEWYHRLRNELYHQGNGLTVERDKVEIYAQLANRLFSNLFGVELVEHIGPNGDLIGEFISEWIRLEQALNEVANSNSMLGRPRASAIDAARFLERAGIISRAEVIEVDDLRHTRDALLHATPDSRRLITPSVIVRVRTLADTLSEP